MINETFILRTNLLGLSSNTLIFRLQLTYEYNKTLIITINEINLG